MEKTGGDTESEASWDVLLESVRLLVGGGKAWKGGLRKKGGADGGLGSQDTVWLPYPKYRFTRLEGGQKREVNGVRFLGRPNYKKKGHR